MSRSKRRSRGSRRAGELLDLPLAPPESPKGSSAGRENLPLFPEPPAATGEETAEESQPLSEEEDPPADAEEAPREPAAHEERVARRASASRRLLAALADLVVHLAVLAGGVTAMALLGLEPRLEDLPGLIVYVLSFSFLYTVVPLAFWGQTPGMAWVGIKATDRSGSPLTFGQTAQRWLAGVLSALLAGLPLLLSFARRSFADLLSGSETWQDLEPEPSTRDAPEDDGRG